ncbi:MAG TPA: NmrA/HSCARG family protein [Terriglobales bacterium]|nr:NmrA/HSCARG family protein [Terriglobales bacterium]
MSDKKTIAVTGATGAQGGGLVRAILKDKNGEFAVRAITRNPGSDKAKELAKLGAEIVSADLDNVDSLTRAFSGAHGVFCLTNYWEHFSPEKEISQVENLAKAAKAAGVKHAIWSTLEDTRKLVPLSDNRMPTLMGNYKVPHFDSKGGSDHFFTDAGVPTTFLLTSFYWDNFIYFGLGPKPGPDGKQAITLPMGSTPLPGIAAEDIGKCAYGIFKRGQEFVGKTVGIAGEHLTGEQMAAGLSKALGVPVRYNAVSPDVYRSFGFPGADDLGNMFQYKHDFNEEFSRPRSVEFSRRLNPELLSFEQWLAKHKQQIPLELKQTEATA